MNAAVVIVTYNRFELLKECIECVYKQTKSFTDVVIVDNACTDGTSRWLDALTYGNIHIIHEETNGGGAKGFSDGVKYVHDNLDADWLLLIDDDAMLANNYIEEIAKATTLYPDCKAFSGSVVTDGKIDVTHRKRVGGTLTFKITPVSLSEYEQESFVYDLCSFCGLTFSTSLIDKIGLPKADYFIWYDDTEYSLRIRKHTKIININCTKIDHKTKIVCASTAINWRGYYGLRNRGDVIRCHGTHVQYFLNRLKIKNAMCKNYLLNLIFRSQTYEYKYKLYRDALKDMKQGKFGFNEQYHP